MGGNIPGEKFLGSIFPGGIFQWEVSAVGISWVEIPPGGIEPSSSSYNISILILQKIFNRYSMTLNS